MKSREEVPHVTAPVMVLVMPKASNIPAVNAAPRAEPTPQDEIVLAITLRLCLLMSLISLKPRSLFLYASSSKLKVSLKPIVKRGDVWSMRHTMNLR